MAISSFMAEGDVQAQTEIAPQQPAQKTPLPPDPADREELVRNTMNLNVSLDNLLAAADNKYSRELAERGEKLTKYLQTEYHSPKATAVYLDPNEFTALRAIGMDDDGATRTLLARAGTPENDQTVKDIASHMDSTDRTSYQGIVRTQNPHAIRDVTFADAQPGVIIPSSAYFTPRSKIDGLTHDQNIEFTNRHEGWHLADNQNILPRQNTPALKSIDLEHPETMIGNPEQLQVLSLANKQECLADVGAAGDMIRAGADPKIIDGIIAWREKSGEILHMTAGALEGLRHQIDEMGVEKFRALDDASARAFYNGIAAKGGLQAEQADTVTRYVTGSAADRMALDTMAAAGISPEAQAAVGFAKRYDLTSADDGLKPMSPAGTTPVTAEDQQIARQLSNYHPGDILRDRAFADGGKITPVTLAKAYGQLQDELREDLDRQPDNKLWQGQAQKLQQTIINAVQMTNYIEENAKRGVDILQVEPTLKNLAPPQDVPAKTSDATAPGRKTSGPSKSM
jgi:hypothetical protein